MKLLASDIFLSFLSLPACTDHPLHCKYCIIPSDTGTHITLWSGSVKMKISTFCVTQICSHHQCVIRNHGVFCHFRQPCKSKDRPPAFMIFLLNCSLTPFSIPAEHCLPHFLLYGLFDHIQADGERSPVLPDKSKLNGLCHGLQEKYFLPN